MSVILVVVVVSGSLVVGSVMALAGVALLVSTSLEVFQPAAAELAVWSPAWRRHSAPCWRSLSVNSGRDDLRL